MEKVNWRVEYKKDNIFNIVMCILGFFVIGFDFNQTNMIILFVISLYINGSSAKFFTDGYE